MTEKLFDGSDQEEPNLSTDDVNYLESFVGEGKKYKTVDELAKAYANADVAINKLQQKVQDKIDTDTKLNEILNFIKTSSSNPEGPEPTTTPPSVTSSINTEELAGQIKLALKREENIKEAKQKIAEKYGDGITAQQVLNKFAQRNPTLKTVADELAASDPNKLVELIEKFVPVTEFATTPPITDFDNTPVAPVKLPQGIPAYSQLKVKFKDNISKLYAKDTQDKIVKYYTLCQSQGIDYFKT